MSELIKRYVTGLHHRIGDLEIMTLLLLPLLMLHHRIGDLEKDAVAIGLIIILHHRIGDLENQEA